MRRSTMILTVVLVIAAIGVGWHLMTRPAVAGPGAPTIVNARHGIGGTRPPVADDLSRPTTGYVTLDQVKPTNPPR